MTTSGFSANRSLMSSQYTTRQMLESRALSRPSKNTNYMNFITTMPSSYEETGLSTSRRSATPGKPLFPKKAQKHKYTMESLKLSCNKQTFLKFQDLKKNIEAKTQL